MSIEPDTYNFVAQCTDHYVRGHRNNWSRASEMSQAPFSGDFCIVVHQLLINGLTDYDETTKFMPIAGMT